MPSTSRFFLTTLLLVGAASQTAAAVAASADEPICDVGVLAINLSGQNHGEVCEPYVPKVEELIEKEFELAGQVLDTDSVTSSTGDVFLHRNLYNCNTYCHNNNYNPAECYYWTQGQCGGRRRMEMITGNEADYPQAVHDLCALRKAVMAQSLLDSMRDQTLSKACRLFFGSEWELECTCTKDT